MIKKKAFIYLAIALMMGVGAALLADNWIQKRIAPQAVEKLEFQPIVIAAIDIPFGNKLQANQLKIMKWPKSTPMPVGVYQTTEEVIGKVASQAIYKDEMIMSTRVVDHTDGSTLSAIIEPKKRAITLRVNDVVGVAGFLLPGNRVDVLSSRKVDRRVITKTLLEDLKVLAVDQTASPEKDKPIVVRAVTIEVEPKQAEKVFKATEEGRIQLVLRNPSDRPEKIAQKPEIKKEVVKKKPIKKKVTSKRPLYSTVTVIRGTNVNKSKSHL